MRSHFRFVSCNKSSQRRQRRWRSPELVMALNQQIEINTDSMEMLIQRIANATF